MYVGLMGGCLTGAAAVVWVEREDCLLKSAKGGIREVGNHQWLSFPARDRNALNMRLLNGDQPRALRGLPLGLK